MGIVGDVRYALRALGKAPAFTAVAVLSLALGIGANTAVYSLVDGVLLNLLPVKNPGELVQLKEIGRHYGSNTGMNALSYPSTRTSASRTRYSTPCSAATRHPSA